MRLRERLLNRLSNLVFILALSLVLGLSAWLSTRHDQVWDWTYNNRSSLATETTELLAQFEGPLRIVAFVEENQALHEKIRTVVERYRRHKADISLRFVNPDLEPELAVAEDVRQTGVLILGYEDRRERVQSLDESGIAYAMQRLLRTQDLWVIMTEGHGEASPFGTQKGDLSQWREELNKAGIQLQPFDTRRGLPLPQNVQLLAITTPQEAWQPAELDAVRDYLLQGGNLLWLQDPGAMQGLDPLQEVLGIQFVPGTLVDGNKKIQEMLRISHPAIIPVLEYGDHEVTRDINTQSLFPLAQAVKVTQESAWKSTALLRSLEQSWSNMGPLNESLSFTPDQGDIAGPLVIGIALTREVNEQEQRVAVIGDSQFASNGYITYGANRQLLRNLVSWLSADEGLLKLSPRKAPDTQLALSQNQAVVLAIGLLLVLPGIILFSGLFIWYRRRRRS
jgi:ABC-type uncharacterized transport system involved in gliding motility auxiliary subunit